MVEDKNYEIGSRVECENSRGTVKYVGPVGNTKGIWLGVDWDDPARGKHNGTYEGVDYFQTWNPTSGSFVRPEKVKFGISCPQAIKMRYGLVNDELAGIDRDGLDSLQKKIKAPILEMVGFDKVNKKQSNFNELRIVYLHDECVSSAGAPGELEQLSPKINELDLWKNLLNSWKSVAEICSQLRHLTKLNVSENNLPVTNDIINYKDAFCSVQDLVMAKMNYEWSMIALCSEVFPAIKELSVSLNVVSSLQEPRPDSNITRLTNLTLEGNEITSWDEVLKIGSLSCLEYLNLSSNKISSVHFPTNSPTEKTSLFPALKQLHISGNLISEWASISELDKLINLQDLKFRDNPLLKMKSVETGRQFIIAKISKLKSLNSVEIWHDERRGAEYDYLKLFGNEWLAAEKDPEQKKQFLSNHPRFPALIEKYELFDMSTSGTTCEMVSNVITVEFLCPGTPNYESIGIKRKLLKDMELQKVLGLVQRLFKKGKIPTLSFVQKNLSSEEIPLDKPLQKLNYYSIQDGDKVLVRW